MPNYPKMNYIGNKEKLVSWICDNIPAGVYTIFDAFSGGCSVAYEMKKRGHTVITNDILKINFLISKALIENNDTLLTTADINQIFAGTPFKGFMYKHFANKFYFPEECMELDLYRKNIEDIADPYKQALAYTVMRRAMIRKMPYSRFNLPWDKIVQLRDEDYSYEHYKRRRAYHNQAFKFHFIKELDNYNQAIFNNNKNNLAYNADIFDIIPQVDADLIYLDPPYTGTMNNYFGFYGLIDKWIAGEDLEPFKNNFVDKSTSLILFDKLFSKLKKYKYWLLSYNNSSYPDKDLLMKLIKKYATSVKVIEKEHAYKVTGKEHKLQNKEYLFIVKI